MISFSYSPGFFKKILIIATPRDSRWHQFTKKYQHFYIFDLIINTLGSLQDCARFVMSKLPKGSAFGPPWRRCWRSGAGGYAVSPSGEHTAMQPLCNRSAGLLFPPRVLSYIVYFFSVKDLTKSIEYSLQERWPDWKFSLSGCGLGCCEPESSDGFRRLCSSLTPSYSICSLYCDPSQG